MSTPRDEERSPSYADAAETPLRSSSARSSIAGAFAWAAGARASGASHDDEAGDDDAAPLALTRAPSGALDAAYAALRPLSLSRAASGDSELLLPQRETPRDGAPRSRRASLASLGGATPRGEAVLWDAVAASDAEEADAPPLASAFGIAITPPAATRSWHALLRSRRRLLLGLAAAVVALVALFGGLTPVYHQTAGGDGAPKAHARVALYGYSTATFGALERVAFVRGTAAALHVPRADVAVLAVADALPATRRRALAAAPPGAAVDVDFSVATANVTLTYLLSLLNATAEAPEAPAPPQCFPARARVLVRGAGWTRLDALETGAEVLAASAADGGLEWTRVIAWLHWEHRITSPYLTLLGSAGANASAVALTLSAGHYVQLSKGGCATGWANATLALPTEATPGMGLWVLRDDASGASGIAAAPSAADADVARAALRCVSIVAVRVAELRGRFSPVTASSNVVVDGASASTLLRGGAWTALTGLPDATHGPPLRAMQRHHAITVALHGAFGQRGLDLLDALHAPVFRLLGVTQPTNGAIAAAQASARAARQGSCDAGGFGVGNDEDAPPAADDLVPTLPGRVMRALSFTLSVVVLIPTLMTA